MNMIYVYREIIDGCINLKYFSSEFPAFKCIADYTVFRICIDILWVNILLILNFLKLTIESWFEIFVPQDIYGL